MIYAGSGIANRRTASNAVPVGNSVGGGRPASPLPMLSSVQGGTPSSVNVAVASRAYTSTASSPASSPVAAAAANGYAVDVRPVASLSGMDSASVAVPMASVSSRLGPSAQSSPSLEPQQQPQQQPPLSAMQSGASFYSFEPPANRQEMRHQQHLLRESKLLWKKPVEHVAFREWYVFHYCNERNVRMLDRVQRVCPAFTKVITVYFQLWSLTGEAEFYTLFIPTLVWLGTPFDALQIGSLLCMGQYITGTMKDAVCCPRPPCPPLELRGKRETHDKEYGFPSTHASHSAVFAYFLYCELIRFFPGSAFMCWLVAVFFWVNVCVSRLYLGMHWVGDLVGGWVVAFLCILFHVAFVNRWEAALVTVSQMPWYGYALTYVAVHALAMLHGTPYDPCPCYIDSMRFTGVIAGSICGLWAFESRYGTLTARPEPENLFNETFTLAFLSQWLPCLVLVAIAKETASFLGEKLLKVVFKLLAGCYTASMPNWLRGAYVVLVHLVALTTRGNERGRYRFQPIAANSSFIFADGDNENNARVEERGDANTSGVYLRGASSPLGPSVTSRRESERASALSNPLSPVNAASASARIISSSDGSSDRPQSQQQQQQQQQQSSDAATLPASTLPMVEYPDGYVNAYQVWSLRTHEHWWLWEVHSRTLSYAVTGFMVTFVCPVLLRELYGVGKAAAAPAQ